MSVDISVMGLVVFASISAGQIAVRIVLLVGLGLAVRRLAGLSQTAVGWRRYGSLAAATFLALWMFVILTQGFPPHSVDAYQ